MSVAATTGPSITGPAISGLTFVRHLGSGGFADVFLYEQHRPTRPVAVKVLKTAATNDEVLAQFNAEANVMAQLSGHPSIVAIYAADVSVDGRPYLVMEYCPPPTLESRYRREQISVSETLETGIRIASAVETLHRAGIVHRDIKPHNILTSAYGDAKLTDFGIASSDTKSDGSYAMSVPWSPPESFGELPPTDPRLDVWALGATLYSLLAGRSPFEVPGGANDNPTLMSRIERLPLPVLARADVPQSLNRTLARAMSKAPEGRHASALELAAELQDVQAELGYAHTRANILDASPQAASAAEQSDDRTLVRVIEISPDVTPGNATGTLPPARFVGPVSDRTGHVLDRTQVPVSSPSTVDADSISRPFEGTAGVDEASPSPARWKLAAAGAAVVIFGGVGAAVVASMASDPNDDAGEQETGQAFGESEPPDAVAEVVATPTRVRAESAAGVVVFSWRNAKPAEGDRYGLEWMVANQPQQPQTLAAPKFRAKAPSGQIVCASVTLIRSSGSASQPSGLVCEEAR
ncbi:MAG: protein kinase [Nocardioides sp.]